MAKIIEIKGIRLNSKVKKGSKGKEGTYYINADIIYEIAKVNNLKSEFDGKTVVILKTEHIYSRIDKEILELGGKEGKLILKVITESGFDKIYTDKTVEELIKQING